MSGLTASPAMLSVSWGTQRRVMKNMPHFTVVPVKDQAQSQLRTAWRGSTGWITGDTGQGKTMITMILSALMVSPHNFTFHLLTQKTQSDSFGGFEAGRIRPKKC